MASNLYTVLSGLTNALSLEKSTRKAEVKYLSSVLSTAFQPKLADGNTSGLVYGGADVTISAGQITVLSAGQVKHDLSIFNKTYNGSGAVSITAGTNLSAGADGSVNVVSDSIESGKTGVAIAGDVFTAIKNATDDANAGLDALSGALSGYTSGKAVSSEFATVKSNISILSTNLGTVSSNLDTLSSEVSGAYGTGSNVVVSKDGGITKSAYTVGAETSASFGEAKELATEKAAKEYTDGVSSILDAKIDTLGGNALTGVAVSGNAGLTVSTPADNSVTVGLNIDNATIKLTDNKLGAAISLTSAETSTGYAKSYKLVDGEGNQLGSLIDIPKDQLLSSVTYSESTKILTFEWANANIDPTNINLSGLIDTYTAGDGLTLTNGEFNVGKDGSSEGFLYVTADAIGVSGIQAAINTKADTKVDKVNVPSSDILIAGATSGTYVDGDRKLGADGDDLTGSVAAKTVATETAVKAGYEKLIGAANDAALEAWLSDTTTEGTGSLAELQSRVDALNDGAFAAVPTV